MMQPKGSFVGNGWEKVSTAGLMKLEKLDDAAAARTRWLEMAGRRFVADYPNHARWLCLRTMTGREKAVESSLEEHDIEAFVPTCKGDALRRRGRIIPPADLPILVGYALVRCVPSASAMSGIKTVKHVVGVLGGWDAPAMIADEFVNLYKEKADEGAYDHGRETITVLRGEKVVVLEGPFAGLPGTVITPSDKAGRFVVIEVDAFGRKAPVLLPLAMLSKV